ncbi:MAG TPA: hypothetical protein VEB20_21835 [Azospirillaceae bacterium]|nr:hypothetical protein [Azospirillaceae bacterium]
MQNLHPQHTVQYALVAFDSDRPFDGDMVQKLERTLKISERWSLAAGLQVRAATLVESPRGHVVVTSIVNIPVNHGGDFITTQVEGALRHVCRETGHAEPHVRNVALVAVEAQLRAVADAASGLRALVDQVGDIPDRFGKILRIFVPMRADGSPPTPEDMRAAAAKLRARLKDHTAELAREAGEKRQVAYVEAAPAGADESHREPERGEGDIRVLDAIDRLAAEHPPEPAAGLLRDIRRLHGELQLLSERTLALQRQLLPKVEELVRLRPGGPLVDRLERYAERVLKPLAALGRLLK